MRGRADCIHFSRISAAREMMREMMREIMGEMTGESGFGYMARFYDLLAPILGSSPCSILRMLAWWRMIDSTANMAAANATGFDPIP